MLAELQSPKMIIEEQMDKVVTKVDPYQKDEEKRNETKNTVYTMDDGSSLLEREVSCSDEAITTTTIAKERFIVRPLDGNIYSKWMDVTHTVVGDSDLPASSEKNLNTATEAILCDNESIMLDISGYKTQQEGNDESSSDDDESPSATNTSSNTTSSAHTPATSNTDIVDDNEKRITKETASSWGWGKSHAEDEEDKVGEERTKGDSLSTDSTPNKLELGNGSDTVQLRSGHTYRIEMSLCGFAAFGYDEDKNDLLFQEKQVSYDAFVHNPSMLNDPRLVFRYNKHYFAAVHSSPLFTSLLIFKHPLEEKEAASAKKVQDSRDTYSYGRGWRQWLSRSSSADRVNTVAVHDDILTNKEREPAAAAATTTTDDPSKNKATTEGERTTFTTTRKTTSVGWSPDHNHEAEDHNSISTPRKMYAKTLRLTSDQLKNLNLKKGVNTISFSVKSSYQGTATCVAKVFYWDYDIQVVISDIDGTITKSDTMGHLMTMIGKDWTHEGVAKLYTDMANNGYHFMYLTSRAIGQADYTRDYLKKVLQGNYQLPDGPVIMSPDRLFTSFHREVIMRKPEMFKMACLKDIQRLFGGRDPFFAGFGNRITDAISYRSVNVPSSRIFTIDPQGDLKLELLTGFQSTYIHLNGLVDQIFPPIDKTVNEEYTDYNFWKTPMPEIDIPELEEEGPIPTSPKPKPIVPDPSNSLPKESIVAFTPEPKRGLLSGFRSSKSSSTSTPKSSPSPVARSSTSPTAANTLLPPNRTLTSSASAPVLSGDLKVDKVNKNDSNISSPLSSPVSLTADCNAADNDNSGTSTPVEKIVTRQRSSSSIISKVMGGVFYRSSVSPPTKPIDAQNNIKESDEEEEDDVEANAQGEEGEEDDDLFNEEIDDLDLSKIPFL